jgi:hypothetical protein
LPCVVAAGSETAMVRDALEVAVPCTNVAAAADATGPRNSRTASGCSLQDPIRAATKSVPRTGSPVRRADLCSGKGLDTSSFW